ncbi:hypothetical protein C3L50_15750 [Flavobacterium alvei]|uniref:Secreted protein n=1 Tax=Flavobacterium alvei TaxID=2080416 RepID=A0A2S5A0S8_9FLAO|nr:hypothetical protein [Flavobacterium alvei]POY35919.1 hypothetical protein C3L50_15750 [Flavobacterium alvei]
MKQFLLFIFIIGIASKSFGQAEFNSKFKPIPPINIKPKPKKETVPPQTDLPKIVAPNILKNTNIFNTKPKVDNSFQIGIPENKFTMTPTNTFVNPGDKVLNRLNRKADNDDQTVYRRNQDLGSYRTKSLIAKLSYRDYGEVDGDKIRVLLNDKTLATEVYLNNDFQGFEITLVDGINKIDFEALNQGQLGPNTAEFRIYDDAGVLISASQWNLGTGFKATIIITKE